MVNDDLQRAQALDDLSVKHSQIPGKDPESQFQAQKAENVEIRKLFLGALKKEDGEAVLREKDLEKEAQD